MQYLGLTAVEAAATSNPYAIGTVVLSLVLQVATMYIGVDRGVACALIPAVVGHGLKIWRPQL